MARKGKGSIKRILIATVIIAVIAGIGNSRSDDEDKVAGSSASKTSTVIQGNAGETDRESDPSDSSAPEEDTEVKSGVGETDNDVSDEVEGSTSGITDLLNAYNAIAEYPIAQDMIRSGARTYDNWVSVNGVSVHITNTEKAMFVDYNLEGPDDSAIVPIMRDFCKALSPSLTDDDFAVALEELRSGKHQYYDYYTFSGIEVSYNTQDLINTEDIRYIVKTGYDLGE